MTVRETSVAVGVLLAVAAAGAGGGQEGEPGGGGGGAPLYLDGPLAEAMFGAPVLAGDFTGEGDIDGVVLDGAEPVLLIRPEVYTTRIGAPVVAHDLAGHRFDADDRDAALAVGPAGLSSVRFDDGTGGLAVTPIPIAGWAGARKVRTGDVHGSASVDVVALADASVDDRAVLVATGDGTSFTAAAGFQTSAGAYDLELLDFDGDGEDEIAVLTAGGVEVFEADGTPLDALVWAGSPLVAAVLRTPAGTADQLAAIATGSGGQQWLTVFDAAGGAGPWSLGALGAVHAAAGDLDGDGAPDLVLGVTSANEVVTVTNTGVPLGASFGPSAVLGSRPFGNPARDPSANGAGLALADLDHDGDLDVLAPVQGDFPTGSIYSDIAVLPGTEEDESALKAGVESNRFVMEVGQLPEWFEVVFEPPAEPLAVAGTRMLEVTVWMTPSLEDPTGAQALIPTTRIPLPSPESTLEERTFGFSSAWDVDGADVLHGIVFRPVVVDGGVVVARGPAVTAIQSPENTLPTAMLLPGIEESIVTAVLNPGGSSSPAGGLLIGPRLPGHEEGEAPNEEEEPPAGQ